ncbi:MAG: exocyst complex component exo70 [Thelocarpon impressellum]|nr:MAG: exocyst complex component exo70 [Thelocarpon impressellum]
MLSKLRRTPSKLIERRRSKLGLGRDKAGADNNKELVLPPPYERLVESEEADPALTAGSSSASPGGPFTPSSSGQTRSSGDCPAAQSPQGLTADEGHTPSDSPFGDGTKRRPLSPQGSLYPSSHLENASSCEDRPLFCACQDCEDAWLSSQQIDARRQKMPAQRVTSDEEDRAEVEVLYARLEKTVYLTKKIQTSLTRLETSGARVKEAVGPIYGNTQKLQVLGQNIDRVIGAIDKLQEPLDIRAREERIIRAGPQKAGLSDFLGSLQRTSEALAKLKATNLRSNQNAISELTYLLTSGNQQLEKVFEEILREDSRPVEPLFYITKQKPFPTLPQDKTSRLGLINSAALASAAASSSLVNQVAPTAQIYASVRGPYMVSCLQNLSSASMNTAKKKVQDAMYRRGTNGIGTYATAMEALFTTEYENVCSVFGRESWGKVFSLTCRGALTDMSKTLRELDAHIKGNLTTDCFLAYEVVDIVSKLSYQIDTRTGQLKGPFADALKPVRETAKMSLAELLEDIRRRVSSMPAFPPDGAVVPVTTDTMSRLQNMADYLAPLSSILTSLGDGGWKSGGPSNAASTASNAKALDVGADGQQLLAHYCMDSIETLLQSLESKGRTPMNVPKTKSLIGAFLANNVAIVDRMIRSSDLLPLLMKSMSRIDHWRKKGVSMYLDAWKDPSAFLLDVQYTNRGGQRPPSNNSANINSAEIIKGLSSKDKDSIKEKFRGFNSSFDDLVGRHKAFALEREVRALLAREVQAMIEPLYGRFWDRYHDIDKGKGKYVKYDKSQLTGILASLG